jgi:hypothetical protein
MELSRRSFFCSMFVLGLMPALPGHSEEVKLSALLSGLSQKVSRMPSRACDSLGTDYEDLARIRPENLDADDLRLNHAGISRQAFLGRLVLRERVREWEQEKGGARLSSGCIRSVRNLLRALRYLEESVAVAGVRPAAYDVNRPAPYLAGVAPYLQLSPGAPNLQFPRDLKSGDVLVSRGNAPTSALIARLGDTDGQFSHAALVYVAPRSKKVFIMEEHIEVGSTIRSYEEYARDQNFRVTVYRHRNSELAAEAARQMMRRLYDPSNPHVVPYDFGMTMDDGSEMFCTEIVYEAFKMASGGKVRIGRYRTEFNPKNRDLLDRFGVRTRSMFAPSDMEVESDFELLGEWRDLSRVVTNQMMDAVLTKLLEWGDRGYRFDPSPEMTLKSHLGFLLRQLGFKKKDLPTNMPRRTIETVLALDPTVNALLEVLARENARRTSVGTHPLTFPEMFELLERVRVVDERSEAQGKGSRFHQWFHQ